MPSPESSRSNLEHARSVGSVKFWRSWSESQRVKADILQAYFAVPRPSQRAVAQSIRASQPYVAKLFRKIKRDGPEKAVGPEAYEQYKALRDAELSARNQSLVAEWQRSQGAPTAASSDSSADTQANPTDAPSQSKPDQSEGPTEYVEWVRTTTGELMPLYGSAPPSARPCDAPPQQASNCQWVKGTLAAVVAGDLSRVDDAILAYIGHNPNRSKGWFD